MNSVLIIFGRAQEWQSWKYPRGREIRAPSQLQPSPVQTRSNPFWGCVQVWPASGISSLPRTDSTNHIVSWLFISSRLVLTNMSVRSGSKGLYILVTSLLFLSWYPVLHEPFTQNSVSQDCLFCPLNNIAAVMSPSMCFRTLVSMCLMTPDVNFVPLAQGLSAIHPQKIKAVTAVS